MRIFSTCEEAISETTREVYSRGMIAFDPTVQGVRVDEAEFSAKELVGYVYSILDWSDKWKLIKWAQKHYPHYDGTLEWAEAWFQERISKIPYNPEPSAKLRWEMWEQYLEENGKFSYTYPSRMYWQLDNLVTQMMNNRYMRGAMLSIWDPTKDVANMGKRRVPCFPPGELVYTKDGVLPIEEVGGSRVVTHMSRYSSVNNVMSKLYTGDLAVLRTRGGFPLKSTPDHEILVVKASECHWESRKWCSLGHPHIDLTERWVQARKVKPGDYIVLAFPTEVEDDPTISSDLCRAFGYQLSEGEILWDKRRGSPKPKGLRLNFSTQDEARGYIDDFKQIIRAEFGITNFSESRKRENVRVMVFGRKMAALFYTHCGHLAHKKRLSGTLLSLPRGKQLQLIVGWTRGDGSLLGRNPTVTSSSLGRTSGSTVSVRLAVGLRLILHRLGVPNSISYHEPRDGEIHGRRVHFKHGSYRITHHSQELSEATFGLSFAPTVRNPRTFYRIQDGKVYLRVKEVDTTPYTGDVFNLEVEGDESYTMAGGTVHNCSISYHFMIRSEGGEDKMTVIYYIRCLTDDTMVGGVPIREKPEVVDSLNPYNSLDVLKFHKIPAHPVVHIHLDDDRTISVGHGTPIPVLRRGVIQLVMAKYLNSLDQLLVQHEETPPESPSHSDPSSRDCEGVQKDREIPTDSSTTRSPQLHRPEDHPQAPSRRIPNHDLWGSLSRAEAQYFSGGSSVSSTISRRRGLLPTKPTRLLFKPTENISVEYEPRSGRVDVHLGASSDSQVSAPHFQDNQILKTLLASLVDWHHSSRSLSSSPSPFKDQRTSSQTYHRFLGDQKNYSERQWFNFERDQNSQEGQTLKPEGLITVPIRKVVIDRTWRRPLYDVTVSPHYFFAGQDKILVHNSQDLINHFPSDVYCALRLGEWMCTELGDVEPGRFISYVDSLHAYRRDCDPERQW